MTPAVPIVGCKRVEQIFWPGLIILTLGTVYAATLLPGVGYSGDTAKFQFVGKVLGTPHATGYPTYIALNHFFTKLFPIGTLAYKANLLSAVFSVTASLFLFRLLVLLGLRKNISFIASVTFGLTYTLWLQSIVAEVYTLHVFFISVVTYSLVMWRKTKNDLSFIVACACYALSFGNHLTMITLLPGIVYFVWGTDRKTFTDVRKIIWVALFVVIGSLQYSYVFWRYYDPNASYLEMQTPSLERLL